MQKVSVPKFLLSIAFSLLISTAAHAQGFQLPASTPPESLYSSLLEQARNRFQQQGVEVSQPSWDLLQRFIRRGADTLVLKRAPAADVALARRNLNTFVDWMIELAILEPNGARVAHESSFDAASRRCPPPLYPYCP